MRTWPRSPIYGLLALAIFSCGPDRAEVDRAVDRIATSNSAALAKRDRLSEIDNEIAEAQAEVSRASDASDAELDARSRADQEMISALNVELAIQRSTDGDELQSLRFRQEQESVARQQQLTDLTWRIRDQERVLALKQERLITAIAPEGGDLRNQVESDYARTEAELSALRTAYAELLTAQSSSPDRYYSEQRSQLDSLRSRQGDLAEMVRSAHAEIEAIAREKSERKSEDAARTQRIRRLQAERDSVAKSP